jgi:prepilin-type N-terminal cleavage/methylation domain-containing protein
LSNRGTQQLGFTLIELMIVVTIIGVLAVVAGTAYRKYMDAGRTSEAMAMLGEIRAKEEAYRAENSIYNSWSAGSEASSASLPTVDSQACSYGGTKEPCPKAVPTTNANWTQLGISPGKGTLQCGYVLNSGLAGTAATGTIGTGFFGTTAQTTPWWYAIAICDNDGSSTTNASFSTASNTMGVFTQNEHK